MFALRWVYLAGLLGGALASPSQSIAKRSTVSEILTDIEDAVTCTACEVSKTLLAISYIPALVTQQILIPTRRHFSLSFRHWPI
jgi:C4-dicarboxylate-specific signal transduction histidine kinase